jgi:hypothetical protein
MGKTGQKHIDPQKHKRFEVTGVACEFLIKAILIDRGFIVSTPDISTGYDFLTDWDDGIINRIQVRSTNSPQKIPGSKRKRYNIPTVKRLGNYSVLIIHIQPTKTSYVIPWTEIKNPTITFTIGLQSKYDKFKEAWELLKETH